MIDLKLQRQLTELLGARCRLGVSMASLTTWRVGGPADCLVQPETAVEIAKIVRWSLAAGQQTRVIGAGSNLLVLDGGLRGVTILMRENFTEFAATEARDAVRLTLGAGLSMEIALERCMEQGIAGLEFLAGIPGCIGGGVRMNAGTSAGDFASVLAEIEIVDAEGRLRRLPRAELVYRYRGLALDGPYVITQAVLSLRRGAAERIRRRVEETIERRRARYPLELPSGGSTFKNPESDYAGRLIEAVGLKGRRIGGARISEKHANFIVNEGGASAADVLALIEQARQIVFEQTGIWLEPEVIIWGERDVSQ